MLMKPCVQLGGRVNLAADKVRMVGVTAVPLGRVAGSWSGNMKEPGSGTPADMNPLRRIPKEGGSGPDGRVLKLGKTLTVDRQFAAKLTPS